ncbi:MAG: cation:proton antiporter, partial [Chitinispirillaceae bacterium]|nr:cation:proton antiporter [Chitinispirillaceae bacterium]
MHHLNESHIFLFLLQLFIVILLARTVGELFKKWKQPALTAELLIGILLGPTVFGRLFPAGFHWLFPADAVQQSMLETAAWIGVLFLLLDTGL